LFSILVKNKHSFSPGPWPSMTTFFARDGILYVQPQRPFTVRASNHRKIMKAGMSQVWWARGPAQTRHSWDICGHQVIMECVLF
jgi:hypothetical protein